MIREQVFIIEQQVPLALEWDDEDALAIHLLAYNNQQEPIGCTRILSYSSIGRMAVLQAWRGHGVGKTLLANAITLCNQHSAYVITLSAQTHAIAFYEQSGFTVCSQPYLDANILHVDMQLNI